MSPEDLQGLSAVIDHQALLTRCLNNLDFAERILNMLQSRCGEELNELELAIDKGDMEAVGRIAHRLNGACANAAAFGLQARASEMRHAANDGSRDKASQCLKDLRQELHRFSEAMPSQQKVSSPVST